MNTHTKALLDQIASFGDLVGAESPAIERRARLLLDTAQIYGIRQVVLVGSGDSYFAAQAAAPAVRWFSGLPAYSLPTMEASRYLDLGRLRARGAGTLVLMLSSSGESARVVEAAQRLKADGATIVAVTAKPQSRLGALADAVLDVSIPPAPPAVGARSYIAALLGVYHLAIRFGEVLMGMTMETADGLRREIAQLAGPLTSAAETLSPMAQEIVGQWVGRPSAGFLGSGPAMGSAGYAAAKLVETAGVDATPQDIEEFHHLDFFVAEPGARPTMVFVSGAGRDMSRALELAEALEAVGRPHVFATDAEGFAAARRMPLAPAREEFAPLLHAVPAGLVAAYWGEAVDGVPFRGCEGPWAAAHEAAIVRNSRIELD